MRPTPLDRGSGRPIRLISTAATCVFLQHVGCRRQLATVDRCFCDLYVTPLPPPQQPEDQSSYGGKDYNDYCDTDAGFGTCA